MTDPYPTDQETTQPNVVSTSPTLNYRPKPVVQRSLRIYTLLASFALAISLAAYAGIGISCLLQANEWDRYRAGKTLGATEIDLVHTLFTASCVVLPIALVVSFIGLTTWMFRAHKNLRSFSDQPLRFSPGGAVLWWFAPLLNLIRPFEVMKEIFAISLGKPRSSFTPSVGCWWGFWLAGSVMAQIAGVVTSDMKPGESDAQTNIDINLWHTCDVPLFLISGVLLLSILWRVDQAQMRQRNISVAHS